tara:strand:+ start:18343 stop:19101 length:759 start_codon:yes stop_codon:yes gene_type:complete
MKIRLHQFLSKCGEFSSKREIKEVIWNGEILINDSIVKDMKFEFNANTKIVSYKGKILRLPEKNHYFLLNKPMGYICSRLNSQERILGKKSIFELFEKTLSKNIYQSLVTVGRLDEDTTGLLLVTTDGKIVDKITNPGNQVSKKYFVKTELEITKEEIEAIRDGVSIKIVEENHIEEYVSRPAKITIQGFDTAILIIHEGKKRQIRRMFDTLGNYVLSIHRLAIGNLELKDYTLEEGDFIEIQLEDILQKCF